MHPLSLSWQNPSIATAPRSLSSVHILTHSTHPVIFFCAMLTAVPTTPTAQPEEVKLTGNSTKRDRTRQHHILYRTETPQAGDVYSKDIHVDRNALFRPSQSPSQQVGHIPHTTIPVIFSQTPLRRGGKRAGTSLNHVGCSQCSSSLGRRRCRALWTHVPYVSPTPPLG